MKFNELFSVKFLIVCAIAFVTSLGLSFLLTNSTQSSSDQIESDTEITLIYFGCSTCPAATDDQIPEILTNLAKKLQKTAASKGYEFSFIGTSKEGNVQTGLNYLTEMADFDEISLGNNMKNTALQRYIWDNFDNRLSASTPQIIISKRIYDTRKVNEQEIILSDIISEDILTRRVGVPRMAQLLEREEFFSSL
jgi:hypothetical protein